MLTPLEMVQDINDMFGEIVSGLLSEHDNTDVHNFSRVSATPEILDSSFSDAKAWLEAELFALPSKFQAQADDQLINLTAGAGFAGGDLNPKVRVIA